MGSRADEEGGQCPRGKAFYSCVGTHFRGCCSVDPCHLAGCPDDEDEAETASGDGRRGSSLSRAEAGGAQTSSTRTDSGITHTVPNHSVVTVTRHTLVFSEAPASTAAPSSSSSSDPDRVTAGRASSASAASSSLPAAPVTSSALATGPGETSAAGDNDVGGGGETPSSGAIVGAAAGALVVGAILVVLVLAWRRRRRDQQGRRAASSLFQDCVGEAKAADKEQPPQPPQQPMSAHTTGTQASADPFAPFGGRFDKDPLRPPSGAFEMDGTGIAPVELPAEPPAAEPSPPLSPPPPAAGQDARPCRPYQPPAAATDPRANLNSLETDGGRAAHVNHWDQWRALGGESP
ncbi:hypothetical protein CDD83_2053 [Cordyceps sp. RAO-2017]|nr:hypothetical protein CDD83_2053 [Cordyceps sp. RAO-2017]